MDMFVIGFGAGLAMAASGWTLTKIVSWIEAKTAHTTALATAAVIKANPTMGTTVLGQVAESALKTL